MLTLGHNNRFNFDFYYNNNYKYVGCQIAYDNYEPFESQLFIDSIRSDSVLLDVGANIGYYTILGSKIITTGDIYSFEPCRLNYQLLEMNILKNRIKRTHPYRMAISNKSGKAGLYLSEDNAGDHQLYFNPDRISEEVETISIDEFIEDHNVHPDIIKIDTQGFDYFVLLGMSNLISRKSTLTIFTEFWNHGNLAANVSPINYFGFLKHNFNSVHYIDELKETTYPVDYTFIEEECKKYEGKNHINLLCKK